MTIKLVNSHKAGFNQTLNVTVVVMTIIGIESANAQHGDKPAESATGKTTMR